MKTFDGIIALGGVDWWYHNRGHYDLRLLRALAPEIPVLYVNSVGVRVPRLGQGGRFAQRVLRKLSSLRQGLVEVEPGFHVASLAYLPSSGARALWAGALACQVRLAARHLGLRRPLLWAANPTAAELMGRIGEVATLHQRTDRFEAFEEGDAARLEGQVQRLLEESELSVYCARGLMAEDAPRVRSAAFVEHGVDIDVFERAGRLAVEEQQVLRDVPRPRVGFVGGLDRHTFDLELFRSVARRAQDLHFVLVGGSTLPEEAFELDNITRVERQPVEAVPGYMAACDVLMMPWNQSPWIDGCNPIKLKEYLAVGRPIVSTPFRELERYAGLVRTATTASAFEDQLRRALSGPHDPAPGRDRVRGATWSDQARRVLVALAGQGLHPECVTPQEVQPCLA